jgi:hypothetical protein
MSGDQDRFYQIARGVPKPTTIPPVRGIPRIPIIRGVSPGGLGPVIIFEIVPRILDAGGTAPPWQDMINPVTRKGYSSKEEYYLIGTVKREQRETIRSYLTEAEAQSITKLEKRENGCLIVELPRSNTSPAQQIAIEAASGNSNSAMVVDPKGNLAHFDGRPVKSKNRVIDVDASLPKAKSQLSPTPLLKRREEIAQRCGLTMEVRSTNQKVVDKASTDGFTAKLLRMGGPYGGRDSVRRNTDGGQVHHTPAAKISPISQLPAGLTGLDGYVWRVANDRGPSIWMRTEDHQTTKSFGSGRLADAYRAKQDQLIKQGKFKEAVQMDIDDIRTNFPDDRYEPGIKQLEKYIKTLDKQGNIISQASSQQTSSIPVAASNPISQKVSQPGLDRQGQDQLSDRSTGQEVARFKNALGDIVAQARKLNTYSLNDVSSKAVLSPTNLSTQQSYAEMLALSVAASKGGDPATKNSLFTAQDKGATMDIYANGSKLASIDRKAGKAETITIERGMTASEKQNLSQQKAEMRSTSQAQTIASRGNSPPQRGLQR